MARQDTVRWGVIGLGWFALPHTGTELEDAWVVLDRMLLNEWGLKAVIEALGPVAPSILELSYSLVYAMVPLGLLTLYILRAGALSGSTAVAIISKDSPSFTLFSVLSTI